MWLHVWWGNAKGQTCNPLTLWNAPVTRSPLTLWFVLVNVQLHLSEDPLSDQLGNTVKGIL